MWKSIEKAWIWQGEIWNRRKTGEFILNGLQLCELKMNMAIITNYCGIFTDLSERKIVENELEKSALT